MKQYLELCKEIIQDGELKTPARKNMPATIELFKRDLSFDLREGFPLLTTKKVNLKNIITELFWFLNGESDVRFLTKRGCNIWNEDTFKFVKAQYEKESEPVFKSLGFDVKFPTYEEWIKIGKGEMEWQFTPNAEAPINRYFEGGEVYGRHWRNFNNLILNDIPVIKDGADRGFTDLIMNGTDQFLALINGILTNPDSRYHIVSAWNPTVLEKKMACLPSCHILYQCSISKSRYLDLYIYQRSCDFPLGVPYDIASYATLMHIICYLTGYEPGMLHWTGGSCHLYENQITTMREQVERNPKVLPKLKCELKDVLEPNTEGSELGLKISRHINDSTPYTKEELAEIFVPESWIIELENYDSYPVINYPFSSGKDRFCNVAAIITVQNGEEFTYKQNVEEWMVHNPRMFKNFAKNGVVVTDENGRALLSSRLGIENCYTLMEGDDPKEFLEELRKTQDQVVYLFGNWSLYEKFLKASLVDVIYGTFWCQAYDYSDKKSVNVDWVMDDFESVWSSNIEENGRKSYQYIWHNKEFIKKYRK